MALTIAACAVMAASSLYTPLAWPGTGAPEAWLLTVAKRELLQARRHQADQQQQPARQARAAEQRDDGPADQRTHHQHLAMGEVDEVDDAVHHGVAQGHQRIHAAQHQTVDDLLQKDVH